MATCPNCGEQNPDKFRFCPVCASPLHTRPAAPQEARKTVTVVFCDLVGSTALGERLDSESLREVTDRYFTEMRSVVERHGGIVEKYIGDAIMVIFGLPRAHEDDALRAVKTAAEMRAALENLNVELERSWGVTLANRTGVNTGEVVVGDPSSRQRLATGDTVNVAARLEQAAPANQVLIGEPTYRLVKDEVEVQVASPVLAKGKAEPVAAYQLVSVGAQGAGRLRRVDAPLIGREKEVTAILEAFKRALARERCEVVTVIGDAGVGKSRVLAEMTTLVSRKASWLQGRCLSYGEGMAFWPVAEVVRAAAGIVDGDTPVEARAKLEAVVASEENAQQIAERVAALVGLSTRPFAAEETFWAVRRLLETLARRRPLVVVFEDLHWGEEIFLELLEDVAGFAEGSMLLACSARPDFLEEHPDWMRDEANALALEVAPLSPDEVGVLIDDILGGALAEQARARVARAAEGNPLFVEQIVSMWIDDGILRRSNGRWAYVGGSTAGEIPASINALLAARLDRLSTDERAVLAPASVVGHVFYQGALEEMCPSDVAGRVPPLIAHLMSKRFVRLDPSAFSDERAYAFGHALIRDAAYRSVLKRRRAELHERFASWLETKVGGRISEYEEILGCHLEQAYHYREQLGPTGENERALAARAGSYLAGAGRRAWARSDAGAPELLERALRLLATQDPLRAELLVDLGEAMRFSARMSEAAGVLEEGIELARTAGDRRVEVRGLVSLLNFKLDMGLVRPEAIRAQIAEALQRLGGLVPSAESCHALAVIAGTYFYGGSMRQARHFFEESADHGRRAGVDYAEGFWRADLLNAAWLGPDPIGEVVALAEDDLTWARARGARRLEATALSVVAGGEAMRCNQPRARRHLDELATIHRQLPAGDAAAEFWAERIAEVHRLLAEPELAERTLRDNCEVLERLGLEEMLFDVLPSFGEALYACGRFEEAEAVAVRVQQSQVLLGVGRQIEWRKLLGKARARLGGDGESYSRAAVKMAETTDMTNLTAESLVDLAGVLRETRRDDASDALRRAIALFERKGNVVGSRRASKLLEEASDAPLPWV